MKKALTILMLALSLATFAQNTTKVIVLDIYNEDGNIKQSILSTLKTNLAQSISSHHGFEGVMDKTVDAELKATGYTEHPLRIPIEQVQQMVMITEAQYALMSVASFLNDDAITLAVLLIDLDANQISFKETAPMYIRQDRVSLGCEQLIEKMIVCLPEPPKSNSKDKQESVEQIVSPEPSKQQGKAKVHKTYSIPSEPQQLTSLEADKVSRHLNRADVCIEMNYIDNAIKEYNEIVKIAPGWANVYMYLGDTYTLKGDEASLKLAIECYEVFMQLTDDQTLYYEAQDKLSRVEMMTELREKEAKNVEDLIGTWKTELHNKYTGQPYFIFDITNTPVPNQFQITVSPKSLMYNNIVNTKAYAEIIDGKMNFSYTFQETYIPKQSKYNIAGATVNYLFGNSLTGALGGALIESLREGDVGYTNILDYDFITDVNVQEVLDESIKMISEKYLKGACHMKGEHHQTGHSKVELDTIYHCALLKGDEDYPIFEKIKNIGGDYYYGNIKLNDFNPIINYSPYVSKEEWDKELKKINTRSALCGTFFGLSISAVAIGVGVNAYKNMHYEEPFFSNTYFVITGVSAGTLLIMCITTGDRWNRFLEHCYSIHNKQVDENIKKYRSKDQASVSVNVGLSPCGAGVYVNF